MGLLDLLGRAGAGREVAEHLRVGIELDLERQVLVDERDEVEAFGPQARLAHDALCCSTMPSSTLLVRIT
jgi:hypothetical protein